MPKSDGWFKKGNAGGGRPVEHPMRGKVSMELQDAIINLLKMRKDVAVAHMQNNPTITEITAWKYINDYPTDVLDRFLGKVPQTQAIAHSGAIGGNRMIDGDFLQALADRINAQRNKA